MHRQIISALTLTVAISIASGAQNNPAPTSLNDAPVAVSSDEVESHRIGPYPKLRVENFNLATIGEVAILGIRLKVIAGPDGVVTSAKAADPDAPSSLQSRAEALVATMRYTPFERNGKPVEARFEEHVGILPLELKPARHVPLPEPRDWNSLVIKLTRTGCLGSCPWYQIEIHGDGSVLYEGESYVAILGKHRCPVPQENVRELVKQFREADYFSLRDKYHVEAFDFPTYTSSIKIDGRTKTIENYVGQLVGMPEAVSNLEASIDKLAESDRWTTGTAGTAACLREEHWNFKSSEAATALIEIAKSGSIEAVRDFIAAGTPLSGLHAEETPLSVAARRSDVSVLRMLIAAGAAQQDVHGVGAAFLTAARFGNGQAMQLLLDSGARARPVEWNGQTTLMIAAASGVPAIVKEILDGHPDVNARDAKGRTALMEAMGQFHHGPENPQIQRAEVVRLLLTAGADPNAHDKDGTTALIDAAWDADAALVLIRAGADVNARNIRGTTPLINCVDPEVVKVLLANGADTSAVDADGKTALDLARQHGMKDKEAALSKLEP